MYLTHEKIRHSQGAKDEYVFHLINSTSKSTSHFSSEPEAFRLILSPNFKIYDTQSAHHRTYQVNPVCRR